MGQMIKALQQKLAKADLEKHNKHEANVVRLQTAREANLTKLIATDKGHAKEGRHLLVGHLMELEKMDRQAEVARSAQEMTGEQALEQQNNSQAGAMALQAAKPSPNVQGKGRAA